MKKLLISSFALCLTGAAHAGLPLLNATCPGDISMHADKGGPVYINGKKAKLKKSNENYFEATGAGVTISISINPDAHSKDGIHDVRYGVMVARKGALTAAGCLNARGVDEWL